MKKSYDYKQEINLKHNEIPAKVDLETGEVIPVKRGRPISSYKKKEEQLWLTKEVFHKYYPNTWEWLRKQTTPKEFSCAVLLGIRAKAYTNSLEPLDDTTSTRELAERFNLDKNEVTYVLSKLYTLGVYGRFDAYKPDKPYTKYWLFNPYLSFNGRVIPNDIAELFKGTYVEKAYKGLDFVVILPEKPKRVKKIKGEN